MSGLKIDRNVIETKDGSSTVILENSKVSYHSLHGSIQESQHVFIQAGLAFVIKAKSEVNLLEIGFGTGLNLLLSIKFCENIKDNKLNYHGVEKAPLEIDLIDKLKFQGFEKNEIQKIHLEKTGKNQQTTWQIFECDIVDFLPEIKFDLIYYDAFDPNFQPELWTENIFKLVASWMNRNGVLVTYCAKGQVKRNLISAGFKLDCLPGPAGKREMTRAIKIQQ